MQYFGKYEGCKKFWTELNLIEKDLKKFLYLIRDIKTNLIYKCDSDGLGGV